MPSNHLYPDPSDLCPCFLTGELDLDDTDVVSSLALGEAMVAVQEKTKPVPLTVFPHAYVSPIERNGDRFMYGVHAEREAPSLSGEIFLNLHAVELD